MSPYLRGLRKRIGNDLIVMPAVAVLIRDDTGRVLLVKHADTSQWGTVGGAIDPDESPTDAAPREAKEETGLDIRLVKLREVLGGKQFRQTYPNGDQVSYVSIVYDAVVVGGEAKPDNDETIDIAWFHPQDLENTNLSDFARATFGALGWISNPTLTNNADTHDESLGFS